MATIDFCGREKEFCSKFSNLLPSLHSKDPANSHPPTPLETTAAYRASNCPSSSSLAEATTTAAAAAAATLLSGLLFALPPSFLPAFLPPGPPLVRCDPAPAHDPSCCVQRCVRRYTGSIFEWSPKTSANAKLKGIDIYISNLVLRTENSRSLRAVKVEMI